MKCPYCNCEMKQGYIQCRDGVVWGTKKRVVAALPALGGDSVVLASNGGAFSGSAVIAFNCETCEKIVIDYGA